MSESQIEQRYEQCKGIVSFEQMVLNVYLANKKAVFIAMMFLEKESNETIKQITLIMMEGGCEIDQMNKLFKLIDRK